MSKDQNCRSPRRPPIESECDGCASKPRILISIDGFYDGGAEMFAIRLANSLYTYADVSFLALRPWFSKNSRQENLLDQRHVSLINLTGSGWRDFFLKCLLHVCWRLRLGKLRDWAFRWRLRFVTEQHKIQIVHSHCWETDKAFASIRRRASFKLVSSFHGHYELPAEAEDQFGNESRSQLDQIDMVVYLSPRHQATLDKYAVPVAKRVKIFYGITSQLVRYPTKYEVHEKLRLVMVGRGIPEKGWADTLEAVDALNREFGDVVSIDLLGTGQELDRLRTQYANAASIRFLGYCDDVIPIVKQAHIGLCPSYYAAESLPNAVIEYLICGKPVIATDVGAIREMITHDGEVAGIVLPLNSDGRVTSAMVKTAVLQFLTDRAKVEQDSMIALKAAAKFEMVACIAEYVKLYNALLS